MGPDYNKTIQLLISPSCYSARPQVPNVGPFYQEIKPTAGSSKAVTSSFVSSLVKCDFT